MSQSTTYQKFVIKNQPVNGFNFDASSPDATFQQVTSEVPSELPEDHLLVKTIYVSNDPAQGFWIYSNFGSAYGGKIPVGGNVPALGIGKVVKSTSKDYAPGEYICGHCGWSEYAVLNTKDSKLLYKVSTAGDWDPTKVPLQHQMGAFGATGITALAGLVGVAKLDIEKDHGLTYLITGAAGAVGTMAVQIAANVLKAKKVIAVAGGAEKCKWVESFGDSVVAVDYKDANYKENFKKALGDDRINVYFDNVGGEIFNYAFDFLGMNASVVCCGAISSYRGSGPQPFYKLGMIVTKRLSIQGFIVSDYIAHFPEYKSNLLKWYQEGKISPECTTVDARGDKFSKIPDVWNGLFSGFNKGKLITQVGDDN
ncbi:hypothetical protein DASC09_045650 [Saccharomycopsis crataegensis]|uniref:Enoyl reductase (ER) domain-containing protein n=1 Tax=Saccharomycopsis crataegensis TaxID=43959 RepID=A0AAV5QQM5_9ASCO|nr:hypothetical protein DASC09_045650 [Saccharomycopsis crataegensis]